MNRQRTLDGLIKRNFTPERLKTVDTIIELDDRRKVVQTSLDQQLAQVNSKSKEIGSLFQSGKKDRGESSTRMK